jgi:predicted RNA-binding protein (TIGR00451 family)
LICREPGKEEKTQINRALDRWGIFEFFIGKPILIHKVGERKMVCLATDAVQKAVQTADPHLVGLAIGELKKQFMPSIAGADLFARYGKKNKFYIVVNEKAEKLVVYGRDIMGESIVDATEALQENELVIVLNTRFEAIGIGRTRFSGRLLLQKGKITIGNVADLGYYLREEG